MEDTPYRVLSVNQTLSDSFKVHFGKVASGDEDIIERIRAQELNTLTGALAVAWEGAGGARASCFMGIPHLEIRGLTDIADNDAPIVFDENLKLITLGSCIFEADFKN